MSIESVQENILEFHAHFIYPNELKWKLEEVTNVSHEIWTQFFIHYLYIRNLMKKLSNKFLEVEMCWHFDEQMWNEPVSYVQRWNSHKCGITEAIMRS